jgi:hypothetical protein
MKTLMGSIVLVMTLALISGGAFAERPEPKAPSKRVYKEGSCCDKASKKGEACKHPCCVKAEAEGDDKVCEKCNAKD